MSHVFAHWLVHLEKLNASRINNPHLVKTKRLDILSSIAYSLSLLPWSSRVIIVAGTNGKGSCVAVLSAIFKAAGYRVGTFTSPHLIHYNERIQIDQVPVSQEDLCEAFAAIEKARTTSVLGYFEFTTLAGLWLFKRAHLDILILEVGLGGRLDPTNMIDADVAIISSISLDHTHILGDTLEAIAFEKAGIMRTDKPCVWGASPVPDGVKDYAKRLNTPLLIYDRDFQIVPQEQTMTFDCITNQKRFHNLPIPHITYLPNAACALQAVDSIQAHMPVSIEDIVNGLRGVKVPGRFQIIHGAIPTVLDVAHNPASAQLLASHLKHKIQASRILMVVAILNTKDIQGILHPLIPLVERWYLGEFTSAPSRAATALAAYLDSWSITKHATYGNVVHAYQEAIGAAQPGDVVVVMGSFHTVGEVLEFLSSQG